MIKRTGGSTKTIEFRQQREMEKRDNDITDARKNVGDVSGDRGRLYH